MKLTNISKQIAILGLIPLIHSAAAQPKATQPQDKPGYDKAKDTGANAPEGADILFDVIHTNAIHNIYKRKLPVTLGINIKFKKINKSIHLLMEVTNKSLFFRSENFMINSIAKQFRKNSSENTYSLKIS